MELTERHVVRLEARLRALDAIIQSVPEVFTNEVLQDARDHITGRPYRHPEDVAGLSITEGQELADDALNEIWRQMREAPVG